MNEQTQQQQKEHIIIDLDNLMLPKCRFEVVSSYKDKNIKLPTRKTSGSAGYDIEAAEDVIIKPHSSTAVPTGIKAYMDECLVLKIYIRSSLAFKQGLMLTNSTGIIDSDFYNNEDNEGHILVGLYNTTDKEISIKKGERIAQGIFEAYIITENDAEQEKEVRTGGIGSTGK